jgi:hypothetical protein
MSNAFGARDHRCGDDEDAQHVQSYRGGSKYVLPRHALSTLYCAYSTNMAVATNAAVANSSAGAAISGAWAETCSGISRILDSGRSSGAGVGSGSGVGSGAGTGTDSGAGTGADSGAGTGTDSGAGTGADSGAGTGADSGAGTGADSGAGTGTDSGAGTGADSGAGTGADSGAGTGADSGAGTGADSGAGTGADSGAGVGTATRVETGVDGDKNGEHCMKERARWVIAAAFQVSVQGRNKRTSMVLQMGSLAMLPATNLFWQHSLRDRYRERERQTEIVSAHFDPTQGRGYEPRGKVSEARKQRCFFAYLQAGPVLAQSDPISGVSWPDARARRVETTARERDFMVRDGLREGDSCSTVAGWIISVLVSQSVKRVIKVRKVLTNVRGSG